MKSSEAAHLFLAVGGALALFYGVLALCGLLTIVQFPVNSPIQIALSIASVILPAAILLGTGYYLVRHSKSIAGSYFHSDEEPSPALNMRDIERLAFSGIGLLVFLTAIPELSRMAFGIIWARSKGLDAGQNLSPEFATYAGVLVKMVAGAYLFFYGSRFAGFWRRIRHTSPRSTTTAFPVCPNCGAVYDPADYRSGADERRCSKCQKPLPEGSFGQAT